MNNVDLIDNIIANLKFEMLQTEINRPDSLDERRMKLLQTAMENIEYQMKFIRARNTNNSPLFR